MSAAWVLVNGLTLLNALLGVAAMGVLALGTRVGLTAMQCLNAASLLISFAMVPDILDGLAARRFGVSSKVGAQLDVNADTTTFNLATALLLLVTPVFAAGRAVTSGAALLGALGGGVYACCGLVRSARLVVTEPPQAPRGRWFWGMTTNGAALCSVSAVMLILDCMPLAPEAASTALAAVPVLGLLMGPLMVSRIPTPDVAQQLLKGVLPRWPAAALVLMVPLWGLAASWAAFIWLHCLLIPVGRWMARRPLP